MISKTIFVIQINLFVKWMTQNTLSFVINGDGSKIATYGHCTSWMLYVYKIKQLYSFCEEIQCIKLYCIYFKSMCFVAILLVDAATLFCLEVTAAEETKELFIICIIFKIIFDNCFKIWVIGCRLLPFRPIAIIEFLSKVTYQMSPQMHCLQQFKAKVVSIMQIFYRLCLQM